MNTKDIGDISEAAVIYKLTQLGYNILLPFGDNKRYDLIIEEQGEIQRIQVKTGRIREGVIIFSTASVDAYNLTRKNYRGQIEYFAIYVPDNQKTYLVNVEEIGVSCGKLRLTPPKNNQTKKVRYAKDYEL